MTKSAGITQRERQDGEDLVAVDDIALRGDGETTVGIPVVCDPSVCTGVDDGLSKRIEVGGPDSVVDVPPVRLSPDRDDLGTCTAQRLRRDPGRSAVCAVHDHAQSVEWMRHGGDQVVDVRPDALLVEATYPPDPAPGRSLPRLAHARGDCVLDAVGELGAAASEELDAVVGHRVVAGGDHHAEVDVERLSQVRDARRRDDAQPEHIDSGAR